MTFVALLFALAVLCSAAKHRATAAALAADTEAAKRRTDEAFAEFEQACAEYSARKPDA
jgi:hypothetical protein